MSYNPEKRSKRYYMLDRKDITDVRGIITAGDVMDELGITNCGFERFVYQNKDYHGCYLVEVDEEEESSKFKEYKFFELNVSRYPSRWYVTCDGRFYRMYIRSGKKHELMPYLHHGIWTVRIGGFHEVSAARVYARYFMDLHDGEYVLLKSNNWDVNKIEVVDRQKYITKNNREAFGKAIGLYEDGKLVKQWPSTRAASSDLYISRQTVSDICKSRYKKKMYDLRYI